MSFPYMYFFLYIMSINEDLRIILWASLKIIGNLLLLDDR